MNFTILDIETDGLLDEVSKIHCLSYCIINLEGIIIEQGSFTDYNDIIDFVTNCDNIVGHNIVTYDIPVLEKILNIKITCPLFDTLPLSWTLYPKREKHGLEVHGEDLGVPKPKIKDWKNLSIQEYVHRCETDVVINRLLFINQLNYLFQIYDNNLDNILRYIKYLSFKMDCIREQKEVLCKIDKDLVIKSLEELTALKQEKFEILKSHMPLNIKFKDKLPPKKAYKKDGSLSSIGVQWQEVLQKYNLPEDYNQPVKVMVSSKEGNPGSPTQIKNWLFSLGWKPIDFEHRKNKAGIVKPVPQVYTEDGVCPSVKLLFEIEPALQHLDMLSLIKHRIGVFEGFLDAIDENDYVVADISGLTNTLRFKHKKPITNLPKINKYYGSVIRGCIIVPNQDYLLCGSDMSSLEDTTKQHYMYFFDPEYVTQMRIPGFDPHLDIAVLSDMLTPEQVEQHKSKQVDYSEIRSKAKQVNFSCVYGAGPPKIALTTGMSLSEAQKLHKTYWERNKAVKLVAKATQVKTIGDQMWLYNPVSKFWYSLRADKDRFSTLNQSSGVYCFDLYIRFVREQGLKIQMQIHDEIAFPLLVNEQEEVKIKLNKAIQKVNEIVKLNVPLGISMDFGIRYSEIH
jgi:DNA polymerase I-like protein with 3'-5' exonuclease and polymerase domains